VYDYTMENDFITWLTKELDVRGWSNNELARRANLASSSISMVISGKRTPGVNFCTGVARAFGIPPEEVMRYAGLLPSLPASSDEPTIREIHDYVKRMNVTERKEVLQYVIFLYKRASRAIRGTGATREP